MSLPEIKSAQLLRNNVRRIIITAYGFEERSLGWTSLPHKGTKILEDAIVIKYEPEKGKNKIEELKSNLSNLGVLAPKEIEFNFQEPGNLEKDLARAFKSINDFDEVIIDITAMTKFLILVSLCQVVNFKGKLRIIYSEATKYSPTLNEYEKFKYDSSSVSSFPSQGFMKILRSKCLSSIRMQGQPVALIAFTSFNEQLVRHMLGTISPYRLVFINSVPPREDFKWREYATQFIHRRLIDDYRFSNNLDTKTKLLEKRASTLYYYETVNVLENIYQEFGMSERIIIAATGSKMQTVGLFLSKILHPDLHIEYPTPDSYFFTGMSRGVRSVHEIVFEEFSTILSSFRNIKTEIKANY